MKTRMPRGFGLDPLGDVQVLCPMNRGGAGAKELNVKLQAALNPARQRKVERFGWSFAPGDKVMQTVNDYRRDVYNGDTGEVANVNPETGDLVVRFHGDEHVCRFGELDALIPAYAVTVYKSHRSEHPAVVIPMLTQHDVMLQRTPLYTALTRGKRLVVLVGQKKAAAMAVRNAAARRRCPCWTSGCRTWRTCKNRRPVHQRYPRASPGPRRSAAQPARPGSRRKLNHAPARTERKPHAASTHRRRRHRPQAHAFRAARTLLHDRARRPGRDERPHADAESDEIMDAINRVGVDGKAVVRTERSVDKGEPFYELRYPFSSADFPGGATTVCLALTVRIQELISMPAPADERDEPTEEGVERATLERLAASIEIIEPAEAVH